MGVSLAQLRSSLPAACLLWPPSIPSSDDAGRLSPRLFVPSCLFSSCPPPPVCTFSSWWFLFVIPLVISGSFYVGAFYSFALPRCRVCLPSLALVLQCARLASESLAPAGGYSACAIRAYAFSFSGSLASLAATCAAFVCPRAPFRPRRLPPLPSALCLIGPQRFHSLAMLQYLTSLACRNCSLFWGRPHSLVIVFRTSAGDFCPRPAPGAVNSLLLSSPRPPQLCLAVAPPPSPRHLSLLARLACVVSSLN